MATHSRRAFLKTAGTSVAVGPVAIPALLQAKRKVVVIGDASVFGKDFGAYFDIVNADSQPDCAVIAKPGPLRAPEVATLRSAARVYWAIAPPADEKELKRFAAIVQQRPLRYSQPLATVVAPKLPPKWTTLRIHVQSPHGDAARAMTDSFAAFGRQARGCWIQTGFAPAGARGWDQSGYLRLAVADKTSAQRLEFQWQSFANSYVIELALVLPKGTVRLRWPVDSPKQPVVAVSDPENFNEISKEPIGDLRNLTVHPMVLELSDWLNRASQSNEPSYADRLKQAIACIPKPAPPPSRKRTTPTRRTTQKKETR